MPISDRRGVTNLGRLTCSDAPSGRLSSGRGHAEPDTLRPRSPRDRCSTRCVPFRPRARIAALRHSVNPAPRLTKKEDLSAREHVGRRARPTPVSTCSITDRLAPMDGDGKRVPLHRQLSGRPARDAPSSHSSDPVLCGGPAFGSPNLPEIACRPELARPHLPQPVRHAATTAWRPCRQPRAIMIPLVPAPEAPSSRE